MDDEDDVKRELGEVREAVAGLSTAEIVDGAWFAKLLRAALSTYAKEVSWEFFKQKYPGLPADGVVDRRIELAQRYAMIEGGLSATAYTAAVAATIGSAGGSSPISVPAAFTSLVVDLWYLSRLQLRLAYDLAVLYRVPINLDDPEDLYDLLRVAFGIKAGEALRGVVPRLVPEAVRQGVKAVVKGPVLAALKQLPVIGKYLLQRNIIKFAIPAVCVPVAMKLNHYLTGQVGRQAREIYRDRAAITELATHQVGQYFDEHPGMLLHTIWFIAQADGRIKAEESWLLKAVIKELMGTPERDATIKEFEEIVSFKSDRYLAEVGRLPEALRREVFAIAADTAIVDHELH
jgi:hypothetical protein